MNLTLLYGTITRRLEACFPLARITPLATENTNKLQFSIKTETKRFVITIEEEQH